jgi:hypothetical protein
MVYLTEETITFNINGCDRDYDLSSPDTDQNGVYKDILLNKDFGIKMGSYLDSSVEEYYCEVVQYIFQFFDVQSGLDPNGGTPYNESVYFTQLYTDMITEGKSPNNIGCDKAKYPMTQMNSTKTNTFNSDYNGISRLSVARKQKTTFVVKNFNGKTHYFRVASLRYDESYGFNPISTQNDKFAFGDFPFFRGYAQNLTRDGADQFTETFEKRRYLKAFPHAIMYMTPIYNNKIPRVLQDSNSCTLIISSLERKSGNNGFDCIINIPHIAGNFTKYIALVKSFKVVGKLAISEPTNSKASMGTFAFHFVAHDLNKSSYGYGGDRFDSNSIILTTIPITYNLPLQTPSKLEVNEGALLHIDNKSQDIRFNFLMSQMVEPAITGNDNILADNYWEWILIMKLYGIN